MRLDASGHGKGPNGTIDLKGLVAEVAGTKVDAHGTVDTAGNAHGAGEHRVARSVAAAHARRQRRRRQRRWRKARVERTKTHLHIDADVSAQSLSVQGNKVAKLEAHVHDEDFIGQANINAEGVRAGGVALDTVVIAASGDTKKVQAHVAARGPDQMALELAIDGTPTLKRHPGTTGAKIVGADMTHRQAGCWAARPGVDDDRPGDAARTWRHRSAEAGAGVGHAASRARRQV